MSAGRGFRWPWRSRSRIESEVDEEIAFHLEMRAERLMAEGVAEREARERALAEMGDVAVLRGSLRRSDRGVERRRRWWEGVAQAAQDVRLAARSFARAPGFTAVAVATLALGIGSSVAIFSVVEAVVLRPLPYPESGRLVQLSPGQNFNMAMVDELAAASPSLGPVTGLTMWSLTLTGSGEPVVLAAQRADASFFRVFGVRPILGRPFLAEERDPARSGVVLLSHAVWRDRFGGDPEIVGRTIRLDGGGHSTHQVIGVMPAGFRPPLVPPGTVVDAWTPLSRAAGRTVATDSTWYVNQAVGRLAPGATVEGAAREVRAAMATIQSESGNLIARETVRTAGANPLLDTMVGEVRQPLLMLLGAVGLVLLLACANLANLVLARGEGRREELALRAALGATRGRIARKLLAEGVVLAVAGGAAGVGVAWLLLTGLRVAQASGLPRSGELRIDLPVLGFALTVSLGSVLLFGLLPALRMSGAALRPEIGQGRRAVGVGRSGRRLGSLLIAVEVALAMVLVTGAGLLVATLRELRAVDPGLDTRDVLVMEISPPPVEYEGDRAVAYHAAVRERLAALPGVRAVGAIHLLPFTPANWDFPYLAEGHAPPADGPLPSLNFRVVTPGYLEAVDIPLVAGRRFDGTERGEDPIVGMVNRALAERLWPGADPIGKTIQLFGSTPVRVVGVVGDVRQHALNAPPAPELYLPHAQWVLPSMRVMVETVGDPAALAGAARAAVWEIDANVPIPLVQPLDEVVGESLRSERFYAGVLGFFGVVGLLLGAVGVYGVTSAALGARRREFGVRMALGATGAQVVRGALAYGLAPVAAGLLLGVAGALAATRLLATLLFGVGARDPATLAVSAAVLAAVAALASWIPARRAGRLDPTRVLGSDG